MKQTGTEIDLEKQKLDSKAQEACDKAIKHASSVSKADGHWCGEQLGNATMTSEYVFLRQSLGLDLNKDRDALSQWLIKDQKPDGSWGLAPNYPGDVSISVEAYLALKILGLSTFAEPLEKARKFILNAGGVAKVRIFTRFHLAIFGLFPWTAVPEMPAEFLLLPSWAPINIYHLSSWARAIVVPLLLISHHQPVFALPNGKHTRNEYIDELWCEPEQKLVPYSKPLGELFRKDIVAFSFAALDNVLHYLGFLPSFFTRGYARRQVVRWILDHQESAGDWGGGIFPAAHFGLLALILEGFDLDDSPIVKNLEAVERLACEDGGGKRIQPCVGPVWDTILMSIGLIDCSVADDDGDGPLGQALRWIKRRQLWGPEGDWRIYNPRSTSGAFSFEYVNAWYPDVDDTAAAIIAFVKNDPTTAISYSVVAAVEWILSMQNRDGGWGAFDKNNDKLFLNKIPFSDMGALCDPSSADLAGRVLEAFGLIMQKPAIYEVHPKLVNRMMASSRRAVQYLASTQERTGAWYGRWGCNYIYGTSNVLCGLTHWTEDCPQIQVQDSSIVTKVLNYHIGGRYRPQIHDQAQGMITKALTWLKQVQNADGGWGEGLDTYTHPERAGQGASTPTQTAWGAMGLLAHLPTADESIQRSIAFLVKSQTNVDGDKATWPQVQYTGTGFPGHWYLGYTLYPHYFPMMALGRYLQKKKRSTSALNEPSFLRPST